MDLLLHAALLRANTDIRVWDERYKRRLLRVDGEPKTGVWLSLLLIGGRSRTIRVRKNVEFFIGLRNKIDIGTRRAWGFLSPGHAQAPHPEL